jgi:hypothetical protein
MYRSAYEHEPQNITCPECGEDAYEQAVWIDKWGGEFHVKCEHCGLDEIEQRDSPALEAAIEVRMGY